MYEVVDEAVPAKVREQLGSGETSEPNYTALMHWVNTTFPLGLARNATTWKSYAVAGDNPITVHERELPVPVPVSGLAQLPLAAERAEAHEIGRPAKRTS